MLLLANDGSGRLKIDKQTGTKTLRTKGFWNDQDIETAQDNIEKAKEKLKETHPQEENGGGKLHREAKRANSFPQKRKPKLKLRLSI